jgi:hypothetical protein
MDPKEQHEAQDHHQQSHDGLLLQGQTRLHRVSL